MNILSFGFPLICCIFNSHYAKQDFIPVASLKNSLPGCFYCSITALFQLLSDSTA